MATGEIVPAQIQLGSKRGDRTEAREINPRWWSRVEKEWKAQGVTDVDFPQSEITKWAGTLSDIPAEFAAEIEGKGYPGWKLMQRWQEITADL